MEFLAEVARLATLTPSAYDAERKAASAKFGVRSGTLDDAVKKARQGQRAARPELPPHPGHNELLPDDRAALAEVGLTEDGIATAFVERYRDRLRYCHSTGKWFEWDGNVWRKDETRLAFDLARTTCRRIAAQQDACGKVAAVLAKASTAAAVERFAQADRAFAITADAWDKDPFLLGTPAGTVDLRTGRLRPAMPGDLITRQTAVAPAEAGDCPLWLRFVAESTKGDASLIAFLQQWGGYCLTGDTSEHALLFVFGDGGNGKSVYLNTTAGIMGSYAATADMDAFTVSKGDRHPTDIAGLKGARMVTVSETEEGKPWAEKRIASLTGGDTITARFMRQDFFTYLPQFKLFVIGNDKPVLRIVNEAMRRRFNLAPFTNKPNQKDVRLFDKLRAEWPGILRWMIDGCLDWQSRGLVRPPVVLEATAEYFVDQNTIGHWTEDCCTTGAEYGDSCTSLFASWQNWAKAQGEEPEVQSGSR